VGWAEYSVGALVGGIMAAQGDAHVGSIYYNSLAIAFGILGF
jgi:hypothetical protein